MLGRGHPKQETRVLLAEEGELNVGQREAADIYPSNTCIKRAGRKKRACKRGPYKGPHLSPTDHITLSRLSVFQLLHEGGRPDGSLRIFPHYLKTDTI